MSASKASNAILAKARAMYGRRLTDNDYGQLIDCKSVPEVAAYLKSRTSYAHALTGLNENDIHRGQLEPVLKQDLYFDIFSLSRYATQNAVDFSEFIISRMEIEQIIRCLTLLNIGKPEEMIYSVPLSLDSFTKLSLAALTKVRSYDDILEVLKNTKYHPVLKSLEPKSGERADIARIEAELHNINYKTVIDSIDRAHGDNASGDLKDLLYSVLDIRNIARIIRLKKYYSFNYEQIKPLLIPYSKLGSKLLEELCSAEGENDIFDRLSTTYLGRIIQKLQYSDRGQITDVLIFHYCKHHLRLSPNPTIVMISYVYLKEIEIKNIIDIIEGTRYGFSAEEKKKLLII